MATPGRDVSAIGCVAGGVADIAVVDVDEVGRGVAGEAVSGVDAARGAGRVALQAVRAGDEEAGLST